MAHPMTAFQNARSEAARRSAESDVRSLREDLAILKEDVANLTLQMGRSARYEAEGRAEDMGARARHAYEDARNRARLAGEDLRHRARHAAEDVQHRAHEQHHRLGDAVSRKPIAALTIAAATGALAGGLFIRNPLHH